MSAKTLKDYFDTTATPDPAKIPTTKRTRSADCDSPSGVSPPQKRADCESTEGDDFAIPEDAPVWVGVLFKLMKKCTVRVDTIFEKINSLEERVTTQFNSLRADIDAVTESVALLSTANDEQTKTNADQVAVNKDIEARVKAIEANNETLKQKCKSYEDEIDALEQYGRRNCLLLHGVPEAEHEKTDLVFCKTISDKLNLEIDPHLLDRSHRLGKPKKDGKPRPIIAKFARYNTRAAVFAAKKQLKGSNLLITESLTRKRVTVLNDSIKTYGSKKVWTLDGEIYTKDKPTDNVKHIKVRSS